ncbi:MAG: hypothetical protein AAF416_18635 [Pseudomonadota bacterium]
MSANAAGSAGGGGGQQPCSRDDEALDPAKRAHDERIVRHLTDLQPEIGTHVRHADRSVVQQPAQGHTRMGRQEIGRAPRQCELAKRHGCDDLDPTTQCRVTPFVDALRQGVPRRQQAAGVEKTGAPGLGERQVVRRSGDQAGAKASLQRCELTRCARLAEGEIAGGGTDGAALGDTRERRE